MNNLYIRVRKDSDLTILDLSNSSGYGFSRAPIGLAMERLIERGRNQVILNLFRVPVVDAAGLGELIKVRKRVLETSGQLKLCWLTDRVLAVMVLSKLVSAFEIFDNEIQALESFQIRRHRRLPDIPGRNFQHSGRDRLKIF